MATDIRLYLTGNNKVKEVHETSKSPNNFTVSEIFEKKNGFLNPVLVTFQNGELNRQHASKCSVTLSASKNETNVEVKTPSGHIFKDATCSERPRPKQVIAIRNKITNKVKLVEVDSAILINSALINTLETKPQSENSAAEVRILNQTFGGKKIVNRLEQREKLNLTSLSITDDIKNDIKNIQLQENVSFKATEVDSILHLLPPCHRDATILSDIYKINEILSEEELQDLKKEARKVLDEDKFNPNEYSQFFVHCYSQVKNSGENIETRLAGILFMETLIKFIKTHSAKLKAKRLVLCQFSSLIHEKILNEFCMKTETSISRPLTMRDKTLCYIIALCLICCNYQIDLKLLSTTTSLHLKSLIRLAQVVGAVPVSKDKQLYTLRFPLPALPKSSKGKIQRK